MEIMDRKELEECLAAMEARLSQQIAALAAKETEPTPDKLGKRDAAKYLGISPATIDRIVVAGRLHRIKMGDGPKARVMFHKTDLDAYLNSFSSMSAEARRAKARLDRLAG